MSQGITSESDALFKLGLAIRRDIVGDTYVDQAHEAANDFTVALQHLSTEFGWGYVWGRPGLDRKTRSLINLGMLTALNRANEFKTNVRAALTNGVSMEEIREALVQATIYCGLPAGVEAFRNANEVLTAAGLTKPAPIRPVAGAADSAAVTKEIAGFYDEGLAIRREVLGKDYVDQSIAAATDFNDAFQHITTEWCWGYAWARPGLTRKMRSILNLGMLTALNRPQELKLHVRGALTNGVTADEVKEILIHCTIYCGVPAGLEAFRSANEVLKDAGLTKPLQEKA